MEESELDEWFNEQKELLEERFYQRAAKDSLKAKEEFDVAYKKLIVNFQQSQQDIYAKQKRNAALQKPIARARERINLFFTSISMWFSVKRESVKRWFFEQKIKRILKDKRDL